jgi:uncharacterized protein YwgA
METLERLARLRQLVQEAGGAVDGRKKLQKLVYLCQKADGDLGYSFGFHYYGVYSAELAQDVMAATRFGLLTEQAMDGGLGQGSYRVSLGDKQAPELGNAGKLPDPATALVRQLSGESASVLEVLSTIVYLRECGYNGKQLEAKLHALKGHLEGCFGRAFELEREMPSAQVAIA